MTIQTPFKALLALVCLAAAGSLQADTEISETRALAPDGRVTVENVSGQIEVQGWDRDQVEISGTLGDSVEELEISGSEQSLRVIVHNRQSRGRGPDDTDLVLRIPAGASLTAVAVSADVEVEGLDGGEMNVSSVSGDVTVSASATRVDLASVSGDVDFRGRTGRLQAENVSGDLVLEGADGEIEVSTVSGDLRLEAGRVDRGRFESVSGDLELSLEVADGGRLTLESMSGDAVLRLPAGQQAEFEAQTFSGAIDADFGAIERPRHGPGARLSHRAGSNGASIRLNSFSGDIEILQQ